MLNSLVRYLRFQLQTYPTVKTGTYAFNYKYVQQFSQLLTLSITNMFNNFVTTFLLIIR